MKLYLVHCGFYDEEISNGLYESHTNVFVVAEDPVAARAKAKLRPEFKSKRMHVDGLQELTAVDGFRIDLRQDVTLLEQTVATTIRHRDLAPKPVTQ